MEEGVLFPGVLSEYFVREGQLTRFAAHSTVRIGPL
jgi:hypothetical protein